MASSDFYSTHQEALGSSEEQDDLTRVIISCLIAAVAVISALVAWRVAVHLDQAGDFDSDGLAALIDHSEARTRAQLTTAEHYKAYTVYDRANGLADHIALEINRLDDRIARETDSAAIARMRLDRETLRQELKEAENIKLALAGPFFPTKYLDPERPAWYEPDREEGERLATLLKDIDVNADAHFADAKRHRRNAEDLMKVAVVLGVSLLLLTLAYGARTSVQTPLAVVGTVLLAASSLLGIFIEFERWQL